MTHASICLEINSPCTLDCAYCFRTLSHDYLSIPFLEKNLQLLSLSTERFVISGGEPLLHHEVFEILRFLRANFPSHLISFTTGLYVNPHLVEKLLNHNDLIDEYLLNFETSSDKLLDDIKKRDCASTIKSNLSIISTAHPLKTRVNIVLSRREIFTTLSETLRYLSEAGVQRIKFFRDIRVQNSYQISTHEAHLLRQTIETYSSQFIFEGVVDDDYLPGSKKIPDTKSSQALCITNEGEILERDERDAYFVLSEHAARMGKFIKHFRGYTISRYILNKYLALLIVSTCRMTIFILAGLLVFKLHPLNRDFAFVTYSIPIYAIYVTIWTSALWLRRSELLTHMASVLGSYAMLLLECGPLLTQKLNKQLSLFAATWDRYENVIYARRVLATYGPLEAENVRSELRKCVFDLDVAVDQVKAYEQYEEFRYFGQVLDKKKLAF